MAKVSFAGFKDPVRRPRYIIWTIVAVLVFAGVMVPMMGVTSSIWFCSQICHKVQDDTIIAYEHSSHAKISCMACHMPVNANPVIFLLHKAEALGEIPPTVFNKFELPLNAESEVALTMTPDKCTQCHSLETRVVTPSEGMKIDHAVHTEKAVSCPICHNRIAHNEDFELTLTSPNGEPNKKHADFMMMTACFRCHGLEDKAPAPGACIACHPSDFELKPESHITSDFATQKHAELALEVDKEVAKTLAEREMEPVTGESKAEFLKVSEEESSGAKSEESVGEMIPPVGAIDECMTCHKESFCLACHGTAMPHSAEFKEPKNIQDPKGHPVISKVIPEKCVMCHTKDKPEFCNECHHGKKVNYPYDAAKPWTQQHAKAVAKSGVKSCTDRCHTVVFCADCHTKGKVLPTSHQQNGWTHAPTPTATAYGSQPASATALHSLAAQESTEQCEVCHGAGGVNAAFCKACHKLDVPHSKDFKQYHGQTGRKDPAVCINCHTFPELCSNCHHVDSSFTAPWINVHGSAVAKNGATGCLEKCHKQADFCQPCHTRQKVLPASHKAGNFVKAPGAEVGVHAQLYQKDSNICTYCHAGDPGTLPNSAYCKNCHKVDMPHATGYGMKNASAPASKENGGAHVQDIASGKVSRETCANCHDIAYCDACHHKGAPASPPWMKYHPTVVKEKDATACYSCHNEIYCSNCHVNLAKRGLLN